MLFVKIKLFFFFKFLRSLCRRAGHKDRSKPSPRAACGKQKWLEKWKMFPAFLEVCSLEECSALQEMLVGRRVGGLVGRESLQKSIGQETCGGST